jgi:hypothetical protein
MHGGDSPPRVRICVLVREALVRRGRIRERWSSFAGWRNAREARRLPGMRVYDRGYMRELRHAVENGSGWQHKARSLGGVARITWASSQHYSRHVMPHKTPTPRSSKSTMEGIRKTKMSSDLALLVARVRDETLQHFARDITIFSAYVTFSLSGRHKDI